MTHVMHHQIKLTLVLDIDQLLGSPIQKKIETESGLKTTLESILSICAGLTFTHIPH